MNAQKIIDSELLHESLTTLKEIEKPSEQSVPVAADMARLLPKVYAAEVAAFRLEKLGRALLRARGEEAENRWMVSQVFRELKKFSEFFEPLPIKPRGDASPPEIDLEMLAEVNSNFLLSPNLLEDFSSSATVTVSGTVLDLIIYLEALEGFFSRQSELEPTVVCVQLPGARTIKDASKLLPVFEENQENSLRNFHRWCLPEPRSAPDRLQQKFGQDLPLLVGFPLGFQTLPSLPSIGQALVWLRCMAAVQFPGQVAFEPILLR